MEVFKINVQIEKLYDMDTTDLVGIIEKLQQENEVLKRQTDRILNIILNELTSNLKNIIQKVDK